MSDNFDSFNDNEEDAIEEIVPEEDDDNLFDNGGMDGFTPIDPNTVITIRSSAGEDRFVGQTRQLIEILIGTGHKADAEKIRDQAVAVLDDERLKSAVTDAEKRIQQRFVRTGNQ